ncbi:unnamed protein product [Prorocentrum cordatum]|uniref:DUF4116 domain-containing protein n=1 Tax=Prorocentrum cordatum TaxID=2364126 RepID=A0ABN9S5S9_9DINO|nr:unnamed protein product [Polarella glacialis]
MPDLTLRGAGASAPEPPGSSNRAPGGPRPPAAEMLLPAFAPPRRHAAPRSGGSSSVGAGGTLQLRVTRLDGEMLCATVPREWALQDVKAHLERTWGIAQREQRLLCGTKELGNGDPLAAAVGDPAAREAELTLVRRPPLQAEWLERVRGDGRQLRHAPAELRADPEVVLAAVRQNWSALQCATEEVRNDRDVGGVGLTAVRENANVLWYASHALRGDREFVLEALRHNVAAFPCVSTALRADRDMVLAAVRESGEVLRFASAQHRADREVVLAAVASSPLALQHADRG